MPQLQNLSVLDRTSPTPVEHIFVPRDIVNGVATLVESTGIPIGNKLFSISLRTTPDGRYKATVKMTIPVVQTQTVNGVSTPVVVRTSRFSATFDYDPTSSTQERTDLVGMVKSCLDTADPLTHGVLVDLQGVY